MSNVFCAPEGDTSYPKWNTWDWFRWKVLFEKLDGGTPILWSYKEAWVVYNKDHILSAAEKANIPPLLLGCVALAEVGGKPDGTKRPAFYVRSFDWMGPELTDRMAITNPPVQTSFGAVSIQLRAAAPVVGVDAEQMSFSQQLDLITCLEIDSFNLDVVAKHLRTLILRDYPAIPDTRYLSEEQFVVAGARYNRGTQRALQDILNSIHAEPGSQGREYSSYGRAMLSHRDRVSILLGLSS